MVNIRPPLRKCLVVLENIPVVQHFTTIEKGHSVVMYHTQW